MPKNIALSLTAEELLYLKHAVQRDLDDLKDMGEAGPCQEIIDEEMRHGREVMQAIERAEQSQVYAH